MTVIPKKKNIQPNIGYYDESSFVSLVSSLRDASGDETPLSDEYVELNRNIYDMITPDIVNMNEGVSGIQYDASKNALVVNYANGSSNQIILSDNYLANAVYLEDEKKARFYIGGSNTTIDMDLSALAKPENTKEIVSDVIKNDTEVKQAIEDIVKENNNSMEWGYF